MSRRSSGYSSKKRKSFPDWIIYGLVLIAFIWTAYGVEQDVVVPEPPISPELGPLLPSDSPRDEIVLVDVAPLQSGTGTAFAINDDGLWLTARHVVDSCDRVGIRINGRRTVQVKSQIVENSDLAVLTSDWERRPLPADLESQRQVGEIGYFFGFPQGKPGEVVGSLIGRNRMKVRGRYTNDEVSAESPRRGRVYSVAPRYLRGIITEPGEGTEPLSLDTYGVGADRLRRDRRVAQVICLVE